ncbi:MAG TPA: nuclear transport factor 2 family protein [bacterium]|jgi:predicted SnoaL-like aldol condensation-catalyzing enzyme|nr:nuclear transport factor 2 family protein [bacterium]
MPTRKDLALDFLQHIIAGRIKEAYAGHVAPNFVHHNPHFKSDAASLLQGMADSEAHFPNKLFDIQHALEDGDLVAVHSRLRFNPHDTGMAVVHLFRFDGDRIAEFWDVAQPQPENMANERGMF